MLILYIGFAQPDEWVQWSGTYARHALRFEQASGTGLCLVIPFNRVSMEIMERLQPDAVILSGFARSFEQYEPSSLVNVADWLKRAAVPILALCGSHQLLGFLFEGHVDGQTRLQDQPIRPLRTGEPVMNPDYHPDYFMERGFYALELSPSGLSDPLFADMDPVPYVYESHYCEIKRLPPDFALLASTHECRIQAIRHRERPLYGVQFHPEDFSERFPAGRVLLENFFRLASQNQNRPDA